MSQIRSDLSSEALEGPYAHKGWETPTTKFHLNQNACTLKLMSRHMQNMNV